MSQEKTAIEKLYENPKAKSFVNHLIQAYLPVNKITKVWEFEKTQKPKCNVCKISLMSLTQILQKYQENSEEIMKDTLKNLIKSIKNEDEGTTSEEHPMFKYVTQGKVMAFTGEKTDTCLCLKCTQDLLDMMQNKLLMGDKNITWLINKMQRGQVFNHFKESPTLSSEEKQDVERIEKKVERSKSKKITTFGDLEALQNLKAKMEAEEKNERKG